MNNIWDEGDILFGAPKMIFDIAKHQTKSTVPKVPIHPFLVFHTAEIHEHPFKSTGKTQV